MRGSREENLPGSSFPPLPVPSCQLSDPHNWQILKANGENLLEEKIFPGQFNLRGVHLPY
jgi:hypothetical protein